MFHILTKSILIAAVGMFCTFIISVNFDPRPNDGATKLLEAVIGSYFSALLGVSVWAVGHVVYRIGNSRFAAFLAAFLQIVILWELVGHGLRNYAPYQ